MMQLVNVAGRQIASIARLALRSVHVRPRLTHVDRVLHVWAAADAHLMMLRAAQWMCNDLDWMQQAG
jgi:hypothetical protein